MKSRVRLLALIGAIVMALSVNAFAAQKTERIDCGNGFYLILGEAQISEPQTYASGTVSGHKLAKVYYSDTYVGSMTVYATFSYSSSSIKATSSSCTATSANGWGYRSRYTDGTGSKVTGYCTFYNGSLSTEGHVSISCDANGNLT